MMEQNIIILSYFKPIEHIEKRGSGSFALTAEA